MPNSVITEADAVTRVPQLRALSAARDHGWRFHLLADDGGAFAVAASRERARHTDLVFVFGPAVVGLRVAPEVDGVVWIAHRAAVADLARELAEIPAPGEPGAPRVVIPVSALLADTPYDRVLETGGEAA
ncbi:hypothetical protein [Actinokineospora iranica]|uniref:Uncharacterized protein n=1 Tax=Actinokineospora iranica TaxID=1271860 RepID=A0A1G6Q602_9PSEU|nr:hypothetical protein [Actinokineospora iranica]SDC87779.1 hypothetical protein SAMN05216174_105111 [Actinokineospora iranica]